jgi:YHS domain-containing protein
MTSFLLRFLIIIVALWLLRRLLASVFGEPPKRPRGNSGSRPVEAGQMVKDPVCGMYMDPRLAVQLQSRGGSFYFCSKECREKFRTLEH